MIDTSLHQSEPVVLPGRPSGHLVRSVLGYSLLTALMIVSTLTVFVPAALIHCAIRHGRRAAWAALALATLIAGVMIAATPAETADATKLTFSLFAMTVLSIALPSLAVLPLIERSETFGRVLMFLLIGSAIGMVLTESGAQLMASFSPLGAFIAKMKEMTSQVVQQYRTGGMQSSAVRLLERWFGYYATVLQPAGLLLTNAVAFVLSVLMIGRLRARLEPATSGTYLFRNFALPEWMLFAFILGGLAPLLKGVPQSIAANVLMATFFLYMLQGAALLRFMLASVGVGFVGALFLSAFVLITGIGPLLLGVAGLFDPFFDFRHFRKRKDDSHESHSD